jgi:hypothetical protein
MDSAMSKIFTSTSVILGLAGIFLVFGFVYETSFFFTLGLSAGSILGIRHYIFSGFVITVIPIVFLACIGLIAKFFSRNIDRDDAEAFIASAKAIGFKQSMFMARFAFLVCLGVWLLGIFEHYLYEMPRAWTAIPVLMLFVLQGFAFAISTSPQHSKPAIAFAFTLSICVCISTLAIGAAKLVQSDLFSSVKNVRDDRIVRVTRVGNSFTAEAKPLHLPFPLLESLITKFTGEE